MSTPVVLITGALTGIGRAAAFAFAREGNRVVVSGRHEDAGQALAAELREFGGKAEFIRADVRREDDVRSLVDQTVARFGRLDAAVNSAGTEGKPGPVTEQTADSYAATFDTNVLGTLLSMKHELRVMQAQRQRQHRQCFVDLRSRRHPQRLRLCRQQARGRGAHHIRGARGRGLGRSRQCGGTGADRDRDAQSLYRQRRRERPASSRPCRSAASDEPDEIANAILFLCSEKASFISGHVLSVDGGKSAG